MSYPIASQILSCWGYRCVSSPQPGDLIVYIEEEFALVRHAGVLVTNDQVISKWGEGGILSHKITHVPAYYGNMYLLFRKSLGDGLQEELQLFLKDTQEKLQASSDTSNEIAKTIEAGLLDRIEKKQKKSQLTAPYGQAYFAEVMNKVRQSDIGNSVVIQRIKDLIDDIFVNTDPLLV